MMAGLFRCPLPSDRVFRHLLAQDAANHVFTVPVFRVDVRPQRVVHHGLVVPATRLVTLSTKPIQNIRVDPNRDLGLARARDDRASLTLREIVFFFHAPSWYVQMYLHVKICRSRSHWFRLVGFTISSLFIL